VAAATVAMLAVASHDEHLPFYRLNYKLPRVAIYIIILYGYIKGGLYAHIANANEMNLPETQRE
jgi:hypothetical protein